MQIKLDGNQSIIIAGIAGATMAVMSIAGGVSSYKSKQLEAKRLIGMPDSYWEAEKAKAEAEVKMHEMDVASDERLLLDERERKAKAAAARLEFQKAAPAEYWDYLAREKEAQERGKTERENAAAQAKAIENAARDIRKAVSGDQSIW